jgi:CMP-N,N'-diacetyllegionaminic acid synthase
MIAGGKVLALITARGGSKGLPRKNLRDLAGRPLIAWTIEAGRGSRYVDRLVVSTEDSEIAAVARKYGAEVPFMRPPELAADDTPGMAPVLHALGVLPGYDWVVLLQPTSPLRQAADIDACLELCERSAAPAGISVAAPEHSPYLSFRVDARHRIEPILGWDHVNSRRQELPAAYVLNGAVYVARTEWLERQRSFISPETLAYLMPRKRSIDIDTVEDLKLAELLHAGT